MLVTPAATFISGEVLSGYGLLGIGLIVASLVLLAPAVAGLRPLPPQALFWMLLAGSPRQATCCAMRKAFVAPARRSPTASSCRRRTLPR